MRVFLMFVLNLLPAHHKTQTNMDGRKTCLQELHNKFCWSDRMKQIDQMWISNHQNHSIILYHFTFFSAKQPIKNDIEQFVLMKQMQPSWEGVSGSLENRLVWINLLH